PAPVLASRRTVRNMRSAGVAAVISMPKAELGVEMLEDKDPQETREWLESLDSVLKYQGRGRAAFLLRTLFEQATHAGARMPAAIVTPFVNTIDPVNEKPMP